MRNPSLVILGVAAVQFSLVLTAASLVPRRDAIGLGLLVARQNGNGTVPIPQCESTCSAVIKYVGANATEQCTPSACCSSTFESAFLNCYTCIGKAKNVKDYSQQQAALDQLTSACLAAGFNVPKLTFPGQNPNRPLSSFVPSSTGSATDTVTSPTTLPSSTATTASVISSQSIVSSPTTVSATSSSPSSTKTSNASVKNVGDTCSSLRAIVLFSSLVLGNWIL